MDSTVTMSLADYDNLMQYKIASERKKNIVLNFKLTQHSKVILYNDDEIINALNKKNYELTDTINSLKEEVVLLKQKKWYQLWKK